MWVCDALDEEAEYDAEEEEGEAAADVGVEAATEEGRSVDVPDAEGPSAATWIQQRQKLEQMKRTHDQV